MMTEEFKIGPWLVHSSLNSIAQNGKTIHIEPKAMDVLVCLAEHAGNVVSKEQLIQSVWANTFVTDYVLIRCISELRKALDDDSKVPHFIETIPKRGYRLVEKIEQLEPPTEATSQVRQRFSWLRWVKARGRRTGIIMLSVLLGLSIVVIVTRPRLALHYNNRGVLLQGEGDIKGAIECYRRALWLKPAYAEAHYNLADAYEEIANYEKAVQEYERTTEADPKFYPAYNNLARLYIIRLRDYNSALGLIDRAMDQKPKELEVQYSLLKNHGWANIELRLWGQAARYLRQALTVAPKRGAAHCLLAKVLDGEGNATGALSEWELCLAYSSQTEVEPEWRNEALERFRIGGRQ